MYTQNGELGITLSIKRRFNKIKSLHIQMIVAMLLASIIPLLMVTVQFINGYREQEKQRWQSHVQELCADFANRI